MKAEKDKIVTTLKPTTAISFAGDLATLPEGKKVSKQVGRFTFVGRHTSPSDGDNHSTSGTVRYIKLVVLTGEQAAAYGLPKRVRLGFYTPVPSKKASDKTIQAFGLELLSVLQKSIKAIIDQLPESAQSVKDELLAILGAESTPETEAPAPVEATAEAEDSLFAEDLHTEPATTPKRGSAAAKATNAAKKGSAPRTKK